MKVKELVAELLKVDQEAEVVSTEYSGLSEWDTHIDEVIVRVDGRVQLS